MNPRPLRCAISDRNAIGGSGPINLLEQAARLAAAGVGLMQLREKDLEAVGLATLARALLEVLRGSGTKLLINGRADVAVAVGAPGVHLTSIADELTPRQVRRLYAEAGLPGPTVTASCHSIEDILRLRLEPLDAVLFGPVFEKTVAGEHVADGGGLGLLKRACDAASPLPVLALGGVTAATIPLCMEAGAAGFAGIRLFQENLPPTG